MEPKFAKGREVSYSTFDRTLEYLTKKAHNTFFRGQVDYSWGLQTKLGRTLEKVGNPNLNAIAFESSMIGAFKREYSAHSESRPHDADLLGWLARMQHYGAPTRLLDWTLSPQIALYFACRDLDKDTDGAVWLFNPIPSASVHSGSPMPGPWDHLQLWRIEPDGSPRWTDPELSTFEDLQNTRIRNAIATDSRWPLPVIPNWVDQRMAGQQSVFLLIGNLDFPMESLSFKNQWKLSDVPIPFRNVLRRMAPKNLISKVRIPGKFKRDALVHLRYSGVTPSSLFPGLDGLGEAISQLHQGVIPVADQALGDDYRLRFFPE